MKWKYIIVLTIVLLASCTNRKESLFKGLNTSPETIASLLSKELLSRQEFMLYQTADVFALHYAEVCAAYGAIKLAGKMENSKLLEQLIVKYDSATSEFIPNSCNHVDANVYGILPLEIFMQTGDSSYLKQGLYYADRQWEDTIADGLSKQSRYWIDDIYMIGSLQARAFEATGKLIYLDRAASVTEAYIQRLQQGNGLFYHGEEAPFFWGRGNGWVAAGFAEILSVLPQSNPHYTAIKNAYMKMMKTLLLNQSDEGMWKQLIDKADSFTESSSTAMFGYAMTVGVKNGILPAESYAPACVKAWNALQEYINEDGKVREVCVGTGQSTDIMYYYNRPRVIGDLHGQAPLLWFANALIQE